MKLKTKLITLATSALIVATPLPRRTNKAEFKMVDKVVNDTFHKQKPKDILVLDNFTEDEVPIDVDLSPDVPHGEVISKIIEEGVPNANVRKINIPLYKKGSKDNDLIKSVLKKTVNFIKHGGKIDAINISMGDEYSFASFSNQTGIQVDAINIKNKAKSIKKYLLNHQNKTLSNSNDEPVHVAADINFINDLDTISSRGTKIYIAAGNGGKDNFNLLSLVDKAINVGAIDNDGRKMLYSDDNSLVNRWAKSRLKVKRTSDGYNFLGGNKTDIKKEYTTSKLHMASFFPVEGTSISSPKALVEDMQRVSNRNK